MIPVHDPMVKVDLPGFIVPTNTRDAAKDFISYAHQNPNEEVCGVLVTVPTEYITEGRFRWLTRFVPVSNRAAQNVRINQFSLDEKQVRVAIGDALAEAEVMFKLFDVPAKVAARNPLIGSAHSHPGGRTTLSAPDKRMIEDFKVWQAHFSVSDLYRGSSTAHNQLVTMHMLYSLPVEGSDQATFTAFSADAQPMSSATGRFCAAVQ